MGYLVYGANGSEIEFDDRTLAHLQLVITAKLRRRESFTMTFDGGFGRRAIWVDPAIPLMYSYSGPNATPLNKQWLDDMIMRAGTMSGLVVTAEPVAVSVA